METALISCDDEEKWEAEEEEEEEEALSLCDLPVNFVEEENQVRPITNDECGESQAIKTEEDFNFGSWGGSLSTEPAEMCAADEVFFKGQILPLRHSISSDSGLARFRQDSQNASRCLSRSESLDRGSLSRFASVSSSSTRSSQYSTSRGNSIVVTTSNLNSNSSFRSNSSSKSSKPVKIGNNFNTHPSPKPQIRLSKTQPVNVGSRNQRSSMWDVFRLGLVRAPELELQDLKVRSNNNNANRNSVSRNSSCNSSNSSSSTKNSSSKIVNNTNEVAKSQQDLNKSFVEKKLGLFSGCKCSVNVVETVPLNNVVVIKSTNRNNENEKAMSYTAMVEKKKLLQELKIKKKMKEKEKEKQEGKQALSRHRTFEWLKELSHASYANEA